ncbi:rod shape-determining protein MreD [Porphyromonas circumdentaria]|uniref:Rod shape-determining protein MreD n=1 Tax=Porphyromonas circumdentaria TaxID=29524 RepID=A0A1T4NEU6_9PORP|nr:rod shape-determining protein MreD [Porphyromonas circumdentaria]MBB6275663.1 rod shape-determining protein MreD [Porphyromonas circumdentaria]SJZ77782.1 rod shape-determining protein MreD [Porphyromonas circumdentaria]
MTLRAIAIFFQALVILFLQVWVFNPLYIFRLATPFPYLLFLFLLPIGLSKAWVTFYSALFGLVLDIFSGTPGLHLAAFTATGFLRNYLIKIFIDTETDLFLSPVKGIRGGSMALLLLLLVLVHHIILFGLDAFSAFHIGYFLRRLGSSVLASYLLVLVAILLMGQQSKKYSSNF